jgi:hypothetical protein
MSKNRNSNITAEERTNKEKRNKEKCTSLGFRRLNMFSQNIRLCSGKTAFAVEKYLNEELCNV